MDLPRITGVSVGVIEHARWPLSKWFYANPLWYYHRPRTDDEIVADKRFYALVDPDLRELCHLLNSAGFATTPSCQGHFFDDQRFSSIWDVLTREAELIRADGLIVTDSETDRRFLFVERDFRLPWDSGEQFQREMREHQGVGYIGIIVPREQADLLAALRAGYRTDHAQIAPNAELSNRLNSEVFDVFVRAGGPAERSEEWRRITDWMRDRLKRTDNAAA